MERTKNCGTWLVNRKDFPSSAAGPPYLFFRLFQFSIFHKNVHKLTSLFREDTRSVTFHAVYATLRLAHDILPELDQALEKHLRCQISGTLGIDKPQF